MRILPPGLSNNFFSLKLKDWFLLNLKSKKALRWVPTGRQLLWRFLAGAFEKWMNDWLFNGEEIPLEAKIDSIWNQVKETEHAWGISKARLGVLGSNTPVVVFDS